MIGEFIFHSLLVVGPIALVVSAAIFGINGLPFASDVAKLAIRFLDDDVSGWDSDFRNYRKAGISITGSAYLEVNGVEMSCWDKYRINCARARAKARRIENTWAESVLRDPPDA